MFIGLIKKLNRKLIAIKSPSENLNSKEGLVMNNKILGNQGEQAATDFLLSQGYHICARNFRVPLGEIDIVARQGKLLVFVEVKTRRSLRYGPPAAAVNYYKQQKIIKVAQCFLRQQHLAIDCCCRFDVIEVLLKDDDKFSINHIKDAFEA